VRIKAAVHVDELHDVGQFRWERNGLLPDGRQLMIPLGDALVVLSEPAARCFLAMLTAIVAPESEAGGVCDPADRGVSRLPARDRLATRIQIAVHVLRPSEVGRPHWDGSDLMVNVGGLVVVLSEPPARSLPKMLAVAIGSTRARQASPLPTD